MYCTISTAGGGAITVLVADRDDNGKGELQFRDSSADWHDWVVLDDAIVSTTTCSGRPLSTA